MHAAVKQTEKAAGTIVVPEGWIKIPIVHKTAQKPHQKAMSVGPFLAAGVVNDDTDVIAPIGNVC